MFAAQMLAKAQERLATINEASPIKDAAGLMAKPHTDIVVACDNGGGMVGVITKTDIVGHISQCSGGSCIAPVNMIMTRDVVCCRPDESLQVIWSVMKSRGLQRIPMLDESRKPVGIIYARDALQYLLGEVESDQAL